MRGFVISNFGWHDSLLRYGLTYNLGMIVETFSTENMLRNIHQLPKAKATSVFIGLQETPL